MLPEDAFVRRLPIALAGKQVLAIEGLVYCGDAVAASYQMMRNIALTHGEAICEPENRNARVLILIHAWTIVDLAHVAIGLIKSLSFETDKGKAFVTNYGVASQLRNKMDHVKGQLQNLANKKDAPPLQGAVSYAHIPADDWTPEGGMSGGKIIMFAIGHVRAESASTIGVMSNPADGGNFGPYDHEEQQFGGDLVGGFQLMAFAESLLLKIDVVVKDLAAMLAELNDMASQQLPAQIAAKAAADGSNLEDLMAPMSSDFCAVAEFETGTPPQGG